MEPTCVPLRFARAVELDRYAAQGTSPSRE